MGEQEEFEMGRRSSDLGIGTKNEIKNEVERMNEKVIEDVEKYNYMEHEPPSQNII